jgi:hypothetical protein
MLKTITKVYAGSKEGPQDSLLIRTNVHVTCRKSNGDGYGVYYCGLFLKIQLAALLRFLKVNLETLQV